MSENIKGGKDIKRIRELEQSIDKLKTENARLINENIELAHFAANHRGIEANNGYDFHGIKVANMYDVNCLEKFKELIDKHGSFVLMKKLENL